MNCRSLRGIQRSPGICIHQVFALIEANNYVIYNAEDGERFPEDWRMEWFENYAIASFRARVQASEPSDFFFPSILNDHVDSCHPLLISLS